MSHPSKPEDSGHETEELLTVRREIERLARLRREVATCLLEVSAAAEHDAQALLSAGTEHGSAVANRQRRLEPAVLEMQDAKGGGKLDHPAAGRSS